MQSIAANTYSSAKSTISSTSPTMRIAIIVIAFVIIILGIYLFYRFRQYTKYKDVFLKGILQNTPFDAKDSKFSFEYNGAITPYIPAAVMPEIATQNTYSFWIFINPRQWDYKFDSWKHVWGRGDDLSGEPSTAELPAKFYSPAFWIPPRTNELRCIISLYQLSETIQGQAQIANVNETLTIPNFDLNRWFHIAVVINGNSASLYRNGELEVVRSFRNPIAVNKHNIYVSQLGGFGGNLAFLQFTPSALNPADISAIYRQQLKPINAYLEYIHTHPQHRQQNNQDDFPKKGSSKSSDCNKLCSTQSIANTLQNDIPTSFSNGSNSLSSIEQNLRNASASTSASSNYNLNAIKQKLYDNNS